MYLDKICSIERLNPNVGDTDKEQYQAVSGLEAVRINIQPATAELTAVSNGVYGQTFQAFVQISNVQISDRITVSGTTNKFIVKGVSDFNWGPIPHLELVLFKGDN